MQCTLALAHLVNTIQKTLLQSNTVSTLLVPNSYLEIKCQEEREEVQEGREKEGVRKKRKMFRNTHLSSVLTSYRHFPCRYSLNNNSAATIVTIRALWHLSQAIERWLKITVSVGPVQTLGHFI